MSTTTSAPARRTRKKICRFCADHSLILDYKESRLLIPFISERGKMIPRRVTGNCAFHQRRLQEAVKRSRILAILPFTTIHLP